MKAIVAVALCAICTAAISAEESSPFTIKPSKDVVRLTGAVRCEFVLNRHEAQPYFATKGVDAKGNVVLVYQTQGKRFLLERFDTSAPNVAIERVTSDERGTITSKKYGNAIRF